MRVSLIVSYLLAGDDLEFWLPDRHRLAGLLFIELDFFFVTKLFICGDTLPMSWLFYLGGSGIF